MRAFLVSLLCGLASAGAVAQSSIQFAAEPRDAGSYATNTVLKPAGDGPFPAVVVVHSCEGPGGLHLRQHVRALHAAGMVVLMQDSFGPRGMTNCGSNNTQAPSVFLGVADAYAALAHLRTFPFVNKERIYMVGYSWGGEIASLLASPGTAARMSQSIRFNATVSNYAPCHVRRGPVVSPSTDRPLLLLMGEKDSETPASTCFPMLDEYKAKGLPVQWHVYPGATHGWDKQGQARNGYFYSADVTADATRRMMEFFNAKN